MKAHSALALFLMLTVALFSSDITAAATNYSDSDCAEMVKKITSGIVTKKTSFKSWLEHKKTDYPNIDYFQAVIVHDDKEFTVQYFPENKAEKVLGYVNICVRDNPRLSFITDLNGRVLGTTREEYLKFLKVVSDKF